MTRWKMVLAVGAVALGLGVALPLALIASGGRPPRPQGEGRSPSGNGSATANAAPQTTTPTPTRPISASVPVVACHTTIAIASSSTPASLPASRTLVIPGDLAGQVSLYSDDQGRMMLLGPAGWQCRALYGADGSGGVSVFPPGAAVPAGQPFAASGAQGIVGSETSACVGCTLGQACPLFPAAAAAYARDGFNPAGCRTRPTAETVQQLSAGVVAFEDPPGVAGDGNPSGGPYPANGVMTFYGGPSPGTVAPTGSWLDTCTLPAVETPLCTASLNQFVSAYGQE